MNEMSKPMPTIETHGSGKVPARAPQSDSELDMKSSEGITARERHASIKVGDAVTFSVGKPAKGKGSPGTVTKIHTPMLADVTSGGKLIRNVLMIDGYPPEERAAVLLAHTGGHDDLGRWARKTDPA